MSLFYCLNGGTMPEELINFFKGIDAFQLIIGAGILVYCSKFLVKTLFPALSNLNEFLENLKGLEEIPQLKRDIEETKVKIGKMEKQLKELVESNILARGGELKIVEDEAGTPH